MQKNRRNKMMRNTLLTLTLAGAGVFFTGALTQASDDVNHFTGKASGSLEQAFVNLKEHNRVIVDIAAKESLTALDAHTVHETTYTLEKALEKLKSELEATQVSLELLHKASEKNATGDIKALAETYLKDVKRFTDKP